MWASLNIINSKEIIDGSSILKTAQALGINLKKKGTNYEAYSPFVDEKTPSFKLSTVKNIATCFSTSETFDCVGLVRKKENLNFAEAWEFVAEANNIIVKKGNKTKATKRL